MIDYDEIGRRRLAEQREADRITRRAYIRTIVLCFAWMAAGLFLLGWSLHTTNQRYAQLAFFGGVIIGNGGICYTLAAAWLRGEQRGDW